MNLGAALRRSIARKTKVIFDVAIAVLGFRQVVLFEFGENLLVRFAEDVGQHVEPTAMGHAQDYLPDS